MTINELKGFYSSYINEVFNRKRTDLINKYVHPEYQLHNPPPGCPEGPASIEAVVQMFEAAFSGFDIKLDQLVAEGDRVAALSTFYGEHSGEFMGVPPTGMKISMPSLSLVAFQDEKIKESWVRNDLLSVQKQLQAASR